jgi:signal transduction histidine kinase
MPAMAAPDLNSSAGVLSERVLVVAPTGDDAALILRILEERGFAGAIVPDLPALASELEIGAGVAVIASEALDDSGALAALRKVLERQESWSEVPVLLLGGHVDHPASLGTELLGPGVQIVLLERPLAIATFLTATEAALHSRRRQYEVKRLLDELAKSAVEIARAHESATRAKDEFLATLGHELRSPMTAIRGWIEILKGEDLGPEEAATAIAMIESSARVQAHIVEDLMDVSRIIAGKAMIVPDVVALAAVVENIVATFRPAAALQGIHLTMELPEEPLFAWADEVRLQQVGRNLISNAMKFTPSGGFVRVALVRAGDRAELRVRDTGEGIVPDLLPHVFERYRQAEGGATKPHGGLGLGLSIVRHLVESHGGTVEAMSEGQGCGAEFIVSLPLHPPPS